MARDVGLYTAIAVAKVADGEKEGCPERNWPPAMETWTPAGRSDRHPWLACAFLAVAAYLGAVLGPSAWNDAQAVRDARAWLGGTEGLAEGVVVDPDHYVLRHVRESQTAWETYVVARDRLNRDVVGLPVAGLAATLGLGVVLRGIGVPATGRRLRRVGTTAPSAGHWLARALAAGWGLADTLGGSVIRVLLMIFCYLAAIGLLEGRALSWLLVSDTANRTLDLLSSAVQSLQ